MSVPKKQRKIHMLRATIVSSAASVLGGLPQISCSTQMIDGSVSGIRRYIDTFGEVRDALHQNSIHAHTLFAVPRELAKEWVISFHDEEGDLIHVDAITDTEGHIKKSSDLGHHYYWLSDDGKYTITAIKPYVGTVGGFCAKDGMLEWEVQVTIKKGHVTCSPRTRSMVPVAKAIPKNCYTKGWEKLFSWPSFI